MQLELVMYAIRTALENKVNAKVFPTYPPKDSTCFDNTVGDSYHKFIIFTQAIEVLSKNTGDTVRLYLYYRNRLTQGYPEFSSCEFGIFIGKSFTSLFKEHINSMNEADFAQLIVDKIVSAIETI